MEGGEERGMEGGSAQRRMESKVRCSEERWLEEKGEEEGRRVKGRSIHQTKGGRRMWEVGRVNLSSVGGDGPSSWA